MRNKVYGLPFWEESAESFLSRVIKMYDESFLNKSKEIAEREEREAEKRERSWSWFRNQNGTVVLRFKNKKKQMSMLEVDQLANELGIKKSEAFLLVKEKGVVIS